MNRTTHTAADSPDVTLGGNAVDDAAPGYDLVTGLGTPDTANLVQDVLDLQRGTT